MSEQKQSPVKIFDMWADQTNQRVEAWRDQYGNIELRTVDVSKDWNNPAILSSVGLASYRADDLGKALNRGTPPQTRITNLRSAMTEAMSSIRMTGTSHLAYQQLSIALERDDD